MSRQSWPKFIQPIVICTYLCFLVFNGFVWGQSRRDSAPPGDAQLHDLELPSLWQISLQMVLWLVVIAGLIFICVWLMKKLMQPGKQFSRRKPINLLFQETIGSNRSICLVQVLDQIHVIGVTNTQISYLSTLEDHEMDMVNQWLESDALFENRLKSGFESFFQRFGRKTGQ
ncbi:MAG: flagellar biosynthetic protein FliO [Candidatus Poribacteria bacterium]|nr:flagellar biosynthetic protein FliO [Candidatus Poribacteria bacterium]